MSVPDVGTIVPGIVVFSLTFAEAWIATARTSAVMRATQKPSTAFAHRAAAWDGLYEAVVVIDMALIATEGVWLAIPIVMGAYLGTYLNLRPRR